MNNYLLRHGNWLADQPILEPIRLTKAQWQHVNKHYPNKTNIPLTSKLRSVLNLKKRRYPAQALIISKEYRNPYALVAFPNFASILSYNNSTNYARSVYELAQAFKK